MSLGHDIQRYFLTFKSAASGVRNAVALSRAYENGQVTRQQVRDAMTGPEVIDQKAAASSAERSHEFAA